MASRASFRAAQGGPGAPFRRALTFPALFAATAALLLTAPLTFPLCALRDAVLRRRGAWTRALAFVTVFALAEVAGVVGAGILWLTVWPHGHHARWLGRHYALQQWWIDTLFGAAQRIFGFTLEVTGTAAVSGTPFLLFVRHASTADTLLPGAIVAGPHAVRLRYVLKRELLADPCLDLVGGRLPNVFVDRGGEDTAHTLEAVRALGSDLRTGDAVIVYPEGTRFTQKKRAALIAKWQAASDPRAQRAEALVHTLPPRLGGPLALLEAAPSADVVFMAHSGFDGAATLGSFFHGGLVGARVRVHLWRVPRAQIPGGAAERAAWLGIEWQRMDAWLSAEEGSRVRSPQ